MNNWSDLVVTSSRSRNGYSTLHEEAFLNELRNMYCKKEKGKKMFSSKDIKKVEFYPPAVKMTFVDGKVVTASAKDGDEYDSEYGMMVCVLKYLWNGSGYLGEFKKWIKKDEEEKKAKEDKIKSEKEAKERETKKRAKNQERLAKRKAAQKEEAIEIQKEAYKRALQELKETEGITKEVK